MGPVDLIPGVCPTRPPVVTRSGRMVDGSEVEEEVDDGSEVDGTEVVEEEEEEEEEAEEEEVEEEEAMFIRKCVTLGCIWSPYVEDVGGLVPALAAALGGTSSSLFKEGAAGGVASKLFSSSYSSSDGSSTSPLGRQPK